MNYNNNDIIIAQSTPIGSSAIAVIRVSGKSLSDFVLQLNNKKHIKPRYNYKIEFKGFGSNKLIDTCVMVYYKAPKSFTGEDLLEVSCHGNSIIVEQIINEFIAQGVRLAYPGEFSYRAFKNNKIDLMQAESIAAKISANTDTYGAALQNMENGTVSQQLKKLKSVVLNTMPIIEDELDSEEDLDGDEQMVESQDDNLVVQSRFQVIPQTMNNQLDVNDDNVSADSVDSSNNAKVKRGMSISPGDGSTTGKNVSRFEVVQVSGDEVHKVSSPLHIINDDPGYNSNSLSSLKSEISDETG